MTTALILIILGLIFIVFSIYQFLRFQKLAKTGISTEGVVFENETSNDDNAKYPVVRFTTTTNEWITEKYNIGFIPGMFKAGQKVTVVYQPDKPSHFLIKSPFNNLVLVTLTLVGLALLIAGIINFLHTETAS